MAINFPSSPAVNDTYLDGTSGTTWRWTGVYWQNWTQVLTPESANVIRDNASLGDVVSSLLTEAQFQSERNDTWVLADGSDVTGSSYAVLSGNTTLPDLRGRFLRGLDTAGTVDPDGAGRSIGDTQADDFKSHNHDYAHIGNYEGNGQSLISLTTTYAVTTTHVSNLANQLTFDTGGDETRPKNACVNFFIKIN